VLVLRHTSFCAAVVVSLTACETLLDIPDDPMLVSSQAWGCLTEMTSQQAVKGDRARITIHACNFVSSNCSTAATGLTAELCAKSDSRCANPLQANITDTNGTFELEVETAAGHGFDGFLAVSAADDGYVPARLFFNPPIRKSLRQPLVLPLIPASALSSILAAAGAGEPDPDRGLVFVTALDCAGKPAPSVTVSTGRTMGDASVLYVDEGVLNAAARDTDVSGLAAISDVTPGSVTVTAYTSSAMGERIGEVSVEVAAQTITYTSLGPWR
jgi:hypothetical protein